MEYAIANFARESEFNQNQTQFGKYEGRDSDLIYWNPYQFQQIHYFFANLDSANKETFSINVSANQLGINVIRSHNLGYWLEWQVFTDTPLVSFNWLLKDIFTSNQLWGENSRFLKMTLNGMYLNSSTHALQIQKKLVFFT